MSEIRKNYKVVIETEDGHSDWLPVKLTDDEYESVCHDINGALGHLLEIDLDNGDVVDSGMIVKIIPSFVEGERFNAYHPNLGTIKYEYIGLEGSSCYNIKLLNLDDNTLSYVENEWFNQRTLTR